MRLRSPFLFLYRAESSALNSILHRIIFIVVFVLLIILVLLLKYKSSLLISSKIFFFLVYINSKQRILFYCISMLIGIFLLHIGMYFSKLLFEVWADRRKNFEEWKIYMIIFYMFVCIFVLYLVYLDIVYVRYGNTVTYDYCDLWYLLHQE